MTTSFPKAEQIARTMDLPLRADPVVKELYGYAKPVLDREVALRRLYEAGLHRREQEVALEILEHRAEVSRAMSCERG